jgi:sugar lactone lactonase YvrE
MYYIDSPVRNVYAYDYDNDTGNIDNCRIVIKVPEGKGSPDGMTIDSEGMLWIAHYNGSAVHRWDPASGEILQTINLPVSRVTACAFGGDKLDTLYITTAINGMAADQHAKEPHAGSLFVAKTDVTGTLSYRFKG